MTHVKRGRTWQLFAIIVLLFIGYCLYSTIQEWIDITHLQQLGANTTDDWSTFTDETFIEIFTIASFVGYVLFLWHFERRRQCAARGEARLSPHQPEADALSLELPETFHWNLSIRVGLYYWGCVLGFLAIIIIGGVLSWLLNVGSQSAIVWEYPLFLSIVLIVCTGIPYLLIAFLANHRLVIDETGDCILLPSNNPANERGLSGTREKRWL